MWSLHSLTTSSTSSLKAPLSSRINYKALWAEKLSPSFLSCDKEPHWRCCMYWAVLHVTLAHTGGHWYMFFTDIDQYKANIKSCIGSFVFGTLYKGCCTCWIDAFFWNPVNCQGFLFVWRHNIILLGLQLQFTFHWRIFVQINLK